MEIWNILFLTELANIFISNNSINKNFDIFVFGVRLSYYFYQTATSSHTIVGFHHIKIPCRHGYIYNDAIYLKYLVTQYFLEVFWSCGLDNLTAS